MQSWTTASTNPLCLIVHVTDDGTPEPLAGTNCRLRVGPLGKLMCLRHTAQTRRNVVNEGTVSSVGLAAIPLALRRFRWPSLAIPLAS